jgi:uncharacterized protein (DUF2249 family)
VAEISKRPGAPEVLRRLGVDHCCGASLSLREAAAAAGVALDDLLAALGALGGAAPAGDTEPRIDVRGLEPPLPMLRVLERLDTLGEGARLEVIHDRRPLFLYPQLEDRGFEHQTDEPEPGVVRIRIARRPRSPR